MQFNLLNKNYNRVSFDCGVEALNIYLKQYANQDQKRSLSRIYVLATNDKEIIGYYTLCAHSVTAEHMPSSQKKGGYQDIPFLLLGRLAVDKKYQGQGFGDALIMNALQRTAEYAKNVGIYGIIVEAKNESISMYYENFGFRRTESNKLKLFLPINTITDMLNNI